MEFVVQWFAIVAGQKVLPFPKGRGSCPCCDGVLIAKCGQIKTHHWAHESKADCDSWSEPIGPWHLSWQNLVRPEYVEVARLSHRADIVGNRAVVIELQHSPIGPEDIAAREAHYGDMVWLFDATQRFAYTRSGDRAFFYLGQTKHLNLCTKPVFLDFGDNIVEVERFSDAVTLVSGFGIVRSRGWFSESFLSDVRQTDIIERRFVADGRRADPWEKKSPIWKLRHETKWVDPASGSIVVYPRWTEYIKVNTGWYKVGDSQNTVWDYDDLIDRHPEIANGWTKDTLRQMKEFVGGTAIILGGVLRLLPWPADAMTGRDTVSATEHLLQLAEGHIQAGRIPILKNSTKEGLIEKAKQRELGEYGRLLQRADNSSEKQGSLFH